MPDALLLLRLEHNNTIRLLAILDEACDRIPTEGANHELLELILEYFAGFPDQCHHPKEDLIYRKMKAQDPRAAERVGDLLAEHEELAHVTQRVARLARRARLDSRLTRAELTAALREFLQLYEHHLREEEETFFPAALETLTEDDWAAIDFGLFDRRDPLFDDVTEKRFQVLRQRIWTAATEDPDAEERALGE